MRLPLFLTILLILLLAGCNDDTPATPSSKAAEAARIEREVARRVETARLESAVRTSRLRTIRVLGFIGLAGGAVAGLVWLRSRRFPDLTALPYRHHGTRAPLWHDHYPAGNGRVIDFPAQPPSPGSAQQPHPPPTHSSMRPRPVLEVLIVLGVIGLLLEIADGHPWVLVSAGVAAALWLLSRSH